METNRLWKVVLKLLRGTNRDMDPAWIGAFVVYYVSMPDAEMAAAAAYAHARAKGSTVVELVDGSVQGIDPARWQDYVRATYPDHPDFFSQQEMDRMLLRRGVLVGPASGWTEAE